MLILEPVNLRRLSPRRRGMSVTTARRVQLDIDDFVAREYPKVVAAVGMITGSRGDAEDAVQDALVGYLAKPPEREIRNLAAWITVVASNRARDMRRSRGAESRALAGVGVPEEASEVVLGSLDIDVVAALEKLPLQQKQVCVLHYLVDQSVASIAEGLGVSEGTVKTQLHRARKALAHSLRQEGHRG